MSRMEEWNMGNRDVFLATVVVCLSGCYVVATPDKRSIRLMGLAAVAQTAQEEGSERSWTGACDAEALRDIVLLGKRRR